MQTSLSSVPQLLHHTQNASLTSLAFEDRPHPPSHDSSTLIRSLRHISLTQALLTLFCLAFAYAATFRYATTLNYTEDTLTDALRTASIILSIVQIVLVGKYYTLYLALGVEIGSWERFTDMRNSGLVRYIVAESVIHCIELPPRVNWETEISMLGRTSLLSISDVVLVLRFTRAYHILRVGYWLSNFNSPRGYFFAKLADIGKHGSWVLRGVVKQHAVFALSLAWTGLCLIAGICMKTLDYSVPGNKLDSVWTGYWAIVVSEATIGYGDIVPLTHVSRIIVIITIIGGLGIYSSAIILVMQRLEISHTQTQLYSAIAFRDQSKRLRHPAACLIQRWWRYRLQRLYGRPFFRSLFRLHIQLLVFRKQWNKVESLQDLLFFDSVRKFGKSMKEQIETSVGDYAAVKAIQKQVSAIDRAKKSVRLSTQLG